MSSSHGPNHNSKPVRPEYCYGGNFSNGSLVQPVEAECPSGGTDGVAGDPVADGDGDGQATTHEEHPSRVRPGPREPTAMEMDAHECMGH